MLTLTIDTSGLVGSLGLYHGQTLVEDRRLELGQRHGQTLIPEIQSLLERHQFRPPDVELLAVSVGPGSFTGLRVGIVCAKTWAYATGCKLAAIGTLEAVAAGTPLSTHPLHVIADAQRGDVFLQTFTAQANRWQIDGPIRIAPVAVWSQTLTDELVTGPGVEKFAKELAHAQVAPESTWHPQGIALARLAEEQAAQGNFADMWSLEPIYLRRSSAEDKWDQRKAAALAAKTTQ